MLCDTIMVSYNATSTEIGNMADTTSSVHLLLINISLHAVHIFTRHHINANTFHKREEKQIIINGQLLLLMQFNDNYWLLKFGLKALFSYTVGYIFCI